MNNKHEHPLLITAYSQTDFKLRLYSLKIGLILSITLIIFNKMNSSIPLIEDHEIEDSVLYKPVQSLAPIIFPSIIKEDDKDSGA